jgi:hypothetical protein
MAVNDFIPQIWSPKVLIALEKFHVYASLFNRDYNGDIQNMGDTVRITGIGEITVSNYSKDQDIAAPQALTDAQLALTINQAKYFNFALDDVDARQSVAKDLLDVAAERAAYDVADAIDQYCAGFYTDAATQNLVGSSTSPVTPQFQTQANVGGGQGIYDYLIIMNQYLTQSLVPKNGRFAVLEPWMTTLLIQDIRFSSFNTPDARQTLLTRRLDASQGGLGMDSYLGRIAGMDVYESNNAPHLANGSGSGYGTTGATDVMIAGHSIGIAFAENLVKVEKYRPPYRFADAIKGLHLYGAKTTRPQALAAAYLTHP